MTCAALIIAASCNKEEKLKVEQLQQELDELQSKDAPAVPAATDATVPEDGTYAFTFDKIRYGVDAGASVVIGYTLEKPSTIELKTRDGWSATVNPSSDTQGEIVVTAPDPAVYSEIVAIATTADGLQTAVTLPVMIRDPYTDATRTDVAAMGYYCMDNSLATDYHFQMMADCGMNMLTIESVDDWKKQLDLAQKYGLKGVLFVNGPAGEYYFDQTSTKLTEIIEVAKQHPALAGYQIFDEPHLNNMGQMKFEKDRIEELDPNPDHPVYINMHPSSASVYSLGTEDYFEYVETLVTELDLKFITFDQYPVFIGRIDPSWPRSLAAVYQMSKKYNIPFWAFTLCCAEGGREIPTLENIRLQCNTNLAYGAQVNQFFVYRSTSGTTLAPLQTWEWKDGIVDGTRLEVVKYTAMYDCCKAYCTEMHNRGYVFAGSNIDKVRNYRVLTPYNESLHPDDLPPQINSLFTSRESTISFVENKGNEYLVIVNNLWNWTQEIAIDLADMVYLIDHDGNFTELQPGISRFPLEGGDMLVFKYR